jgi:hypothetical protein
VSRTTTVYLLHFTPAYTVPTVTGGTKRAGHYLGSCAGDPHARLAEHLAGRGSPLVRAAVAAGCRVQLVRTWPGSRVEERQLKRGRRHAALCPLCSRRPIRVTRRPAAG